MTDDRWAAGPIVYGGIHTSLTDARHTKATIGDNPAGPVVINRLTPVED